MDAMAWYTGLIATIRGAIDLPAAIRAATYTPTSILPPSRTAPYAGAQDAATIPAVYRALDVLVTGVQQLTLSARDTAGRPVAHQLVRRPSLTLSRADWLGQIVLALATDGNSFVHTRRAPGGDILDLELWTPATVREDIDQLGRINGYWHQGRKYPARDVIHLAKLRLPGQTRGLGPIQAAQATMRGAIDMRSTMSAWWDDTGQPAGILTSDQALTTADATLYRNAWNGLSADGAPVETTDNPSRIKVLGKGLRYDPIILKPADAMWLEAQAFGTLEIARLFGIPASLMMAAPDGSTQTYANVEQEWIGFLRFTLMAYLRPLEEALSGLLDLEVRFNVDALLRTDTKSRYDAHQVGLTAGFLTVNEVRALEGLTPLEGGDTPRVPQPAIPASTGESQ